MGTPYALLIEFMADHRSKHSEERALPTFAVAREAYKLALKDLGRGLNPADWPRLMLFLESRLNPGETLVVPPSLFAAADFDFLGDIILPDLIRILEADILGFAARAAFVILDDATNVDEDDRPHLTNALKIVALQVADRDHHECWLASLDDLCATESEPTWRPLDPRFGLFADKLRQRLCLHG